jgi:glycogen synthase
LKFAPQIVHCNDWHTALLPMLLKTVYAWDALLAPAQTVLSIHNIGYQGWFDARRRTTSVGNVWTCWHPKRAPAADSIGCAREFATRTQSRR